MHVLFGAIIMALVRCDTFPTHPNDDAHRMHSAIVERHQ